MLPQRIGAECKPRRVRPTAQRGVGLHKFFHFVPTMASSPVDRTDYSNYSELAATEFSDDEEQPTMRAPTPEVCPPPALPHPPRIRALCVSRDPSARAPLPKPLARRPAKLRPPSPPRRVPPSPSFLSLSHLSVLFSFFFPPARRGLHRLDGRRHPVHAEHSSRSAAKVPHS